MMDNQPQSPVVIQYEYNNEQEIKQQAQELSSISSYSELLQKKIESDFDQSPINFLEKNNTFQRVVLVSYPRSGNSMLRKYLEELTRIYTGSDGQIKRNLNAQLKQFGLNGEGITDQRVWIVKSHFPQRLGQITFKAQKCILLVRNPLDAFDSFFNMIATGTHNASVQDSQYTNFKEVWERFIMQETKIWEKFHQFWLKAPIPVFIVKYQDLLNKPHQTLLGLFRFLLNVRSLKLTVIDQVIQEHLQSLKSAKVYEPRVGKFNSSMNHYNQKQLVSIKNQLGDLMTKFGYISGDYSNPTNVFYSSDKSDDDDDDDDDDESNKNENNFDNSDDQSNEPSNSIASKNSKKASSPSKKKKKNLKKKGTIKQNVMINQHSDEDKESESQSQQFLSSSTSSEQQEQQKYHQFKVKDHNEQALAISKVQQHFEEQKKYQEDNSKNLRKLAPFQKKNISEIKKLSQQYKVLSNGVKQINPQAIVKLMTINESKSIVRESSAEDPNARGMKFYRSQLRGKVKLKIKLKSRGSQEKIDQFSQI